MTSTPHTRGRDRPGRDREEEVIMGELRDRMVRDMDVRHFSGRTVEAYVAGVRGLAKYYMRSPEDLSDEEVQRYLLHLREERRLSSSSCNQIRCALKFLFEVTLRRAQPSLTVPPIRQAQKLPEILSREEVERIVGATRTRRERVLLMATYGGGLRDLKGKAVVRDEIAATMETGSAWVDLYWYKPGHNTPARKQTFLRKVQHGQDTYIVGSGMYLE
jgi:integrase